MKTKLNLFAAGLFLAATNSALATVRYVDVNSANPRSPYTTWATAARVIQVAVDAAAAGDQILVTNGVYATGGRAVYGTMTNRVAVGKKLLTVRSVNGPQFTVINGLGGVRCVYLTNGASLSGFTLTNGVADRGGGVFGESMSEVVSNCVLTSNSANAPGGSGGGAYGGTLNNCTLTGNSAVFPAFSGGGADSCTLYNCTLTDNSGVGASGATLYNCTLTCNSGGGAFYSTLYNCIVCYNTAGVAANYDSFSILNYCCTTPQPTSGTNNFSLDPQLASASHLSVFSPCRGAGNATYATGTDIDGEAWGSPPSIGCDEYHAGAVTGALNVAISAAYTNVAAGFPVGLTALIEGRTSASAWDFGDGIVVSNRPYASHAWAAAGDYVVVLWAYNESLPAGVSGTVTIHVVAQPVYYVAADSANPLPPYTSWATAATNIQDAVDAFGAVPVPGSQVLVTNGTYASVAVRRNLLTVRSVNGPKVTVINGSGAGRCVYLTNDTVLVGFTLTNGVYGYGGGVYCESTSAMVSNCVLSGNSGGGAYGGTLNNCTLSGNSSYDPNGGSGGGAAYCTLYNCTLTGNSTSGGWYGGWGGGAANCMLNNCTLVGNASAGGGGTHDCTLNNCVVYYNSPNDCDGDTLNYCCTPSQPSSGVGNITNAPLFVDQAGGNLRLQMDSPCINAGNNSHVVGTTDLDGNPRIVGGAVDIGAYEFPAPEHLSMGIVATFTNVAVGFPVGLTAVIYGRATASLWDFGDGIVVSNLVHASHVWAAAGDYVVVLWAYNESLPAGVSATVTIHVVAPPVHYVAADSANPLPPYTSWATAATNIQDAVDAATVPGELVVVTNGIYAAGGRAGNRVVVDKPLTVRSVKGPQFTVINGQGEVRCVSLASNAVLSGFILTNGAAGTAVGGGASGGTLNNCALTGNSAIGGLGGGAYNCMLNNCTLTGNSAQYGGGAANCTVNNCTLTGNSATGYSEFSAYGGGAFSCMLNNCIVYYNNGLDDYDGGTLTYCCTTPMPTGGVGNITNAPLFVDQVGGNLRLQPNSPCINAGNNAYVIGSTDLDGNPRIVSGTVDIGAYEFQGLGSVISYAWLQQYGLPTDGSADFADPDGDHMNNWQEWRCGTCPTNALSVLQMLSVSNAVSGMTVSWQSVAGVNYFLERSTNLAATPCFTCVATNVPGQPGTTTYTDTNALGAGPFFYRVGVGN